MISRRKKAGSTHQEHGLTIISFTIATITDEACLGFPRLYVEAPTHVEHRGPAELAWGLGFFFCEFHTRMGQSEIWISSNPSTSCVSRAEPVFFSSVHRLHGMPLPPQTPLLPLFPPHCS